MSFPQVDFGSICKLQNGRAFKPTEWRESGVPIIRIQNLNDESKPFNYCDSDIEEKYHVKNGDLLFSWSGTPGTSFGAFFWNRGAGYLNQHIFLVNLDEKVVLKDYLRYALNSQLQVIIDQSHGGVGLQHITKAKLEKIKIPLPPLETQKQIAAVLEKADQLRKDCQQIEQELNSLAQSVFIDMFGDPVTNPKGWETKKLIELIDSSRGVSYGVVQRGIQADDGVPLVRISDFTNNFFNASNLVKCEKEISDKYSRTILKGGELLISIRGTVGRIAIVPVSAKGWNVSREVAIIPTLDKSKNDFMYDLLLSAPIQREVLGQVKGVAQSGINLADLRELPVIQPDKKVLEEYLKKIRVRDEIRKALINKTIDAEELFNSLMQSAFKGELKLKPSKTKAA